MWAARRPRHWAERQSSRPTGPSSRSGDTSPCPTENRRGTTRNRRGSSRSVAVHRRIGAAPRKSSGSTESSSGPGAPCPGSVGTWRRAALPLLGPVGNTRRPVRHPRGSAMRASDPRRNAGGALWHAKVSLPHSNDPLPHHDVRSQMLADQCTSRRYQCYTRRYPSDTDGTISQEASTACNAHDAVYHERVPPQTAHVPADIRLVLLHIDAVPGRIKLVPTKTVAFRWTIVRARSITTRYQRDRSRYQCA